MVTRISGQFLTYDPQYTYADVTDGSGAVIRRDIISSGTIAFANATTNYASVDSVELAELRDESKMLYALIDAGVESWEGYNEALAIWRERQ